MAKQVIEKKNQVLEKLEIEYVACDNISPNRYNPNRQGEHEFGMLVRSMQTNGCTQPVIVRRAPGGQGYLTDYVIVDGEHRWRAWKSLGNTLIPVVVVPMSEEQAKIATLRHNLARGMEEAGLAAELIKSLAALGALEEMRQELLLSDVEIERLTGDLALDEAAALQVDIPPEMLGPNGRGLAEGDADHGVDLSADERRAKEKILFGMKRGEERVMTAQDSRYRLMLIFTGEEAKIVKAALAKLNVSAPEAILELCRRAKAA